MKSGGLFLARNSK